MPLQVLRNTSEPESHICHCQPLEIGLLQPRLCAGGPMEQAAPCPLLKSGRPSQCEIGAYPEGATHNQPEDPSGQPASRRPWSRKHLRRVEPLPVRDDQSRRGACCADTAFSFLFSMSNWTLHEHVQRHSSLALKGNLRWTTEQLLSCI